MNQDWAESKISELLSEALFSRDGFRFSIGITPLRPEEFFANHGNKEILRQRRKLLQERPADYMQALERTHWQALVSPVQQWEPAAAKDDIKSLGSSWEPDFVVLDKNEPNHVLGGCVCFPSGWSLHDKVGKSLFTTHAPVPGMNQLLAAKISQFVSRLDSKRCFLILFGIRVFHVPLPRVRANAALAELLAENLASMPDPVAQYKRLIDCRANLIGYLRS